MGVAIQSLAMTSTGSKISKEKKCSNGRPTVANLPIPQTGRHTRQWRKVFVPYLIRWAGTQEDLFGTTGRINDPVANMWTEIFPNFVLDEEKLAVVIRVVRLFENSNVLAILILW